jgi:hypothetical protein
LLHLDTNGKSRRPHGCTAAKYSQWNEELHAKKPQGVSILGAIGCAY